jgi:hypothetical protein
MAGQQVDRQVFQQLASALRAGDDEIARSIAEREGVPFSLLTHWDLGPRGTLDLDDAATALRVVSALAAGVPVAPEELTETAVVDLVADAVEIVAEPGGDHPWVRSIAALGERPPAVRELLQARAAEGSGRCDEARSLIASCVLAAPGLVPAVRDAMEYELCAGNWARAFELALALGDDPVAEPLLRPLEKLRQPARGTERTGRNQQCPCGSGRKYKACCLAKDREGGTHPLTARAPALYAMLASYAQRARAGQVTGRMKACAIGAPHAAMLALDLAIFDGGVARQFLASRGHLLRPDERPLLEDWLTRPVDMYEVSWVRRGSELGLRSMVGGPQRIWQRDRMFSMSVRRLDIVIGRLLPDGERMSDGGAYLRALGGLGILPRDLREDVQGLFTGRPELPGGTPGFPQRLLSRFAQQAKTVFQTSDGEEHQFCETKIAVSRSVWPVWERLTEPCLPPPEPPIRTARDYNAYVAGLPSRFWVRNSDDEVEYVGQLQPGRLANLGAIQRTSRGFVVTANSVSRAAAAEAVVLDTAAAAGQEATVSARSSQDASELMGEVGDRDDDGPDSREAMCRRLGVEAALTEVKPRVLILEGYFFPVDPHGARADAVVAQLNHELGVRSLLESRDAEGLTPAEAVAAGGTARERVLATIDDCEWRLARAEAEGKDNGLLPHPDELRRLLGLPARS